MDVNSSDDDVTIERAYKVQLNLSRRQTHTLTRLSGATRHVMRFAGKPKVSALLDQLFINSYVNAARAEKILSASNPTARQVVVLLQQGGLLKEISRIWGKLYLAEPILDSVQSWG